MSEVYTPFLLSEDTTTMNSAESQRVSPAKLAITSGALWKSQLEELVAKKNMKSKNL